MFKMWRLADACMLGVLAAGTRWDMKEQSLPVWYMIGSTLLAFGFQVWFVKLDPWLWVMGGLTGAVFLLFSWITKEGFAYGDSWMLLNLGIYLGIWKVLILLMFAFFFSSVTAVWGMHYRKWGRKKRIPFFPFLLIGYVGVLAW